jgi:hypothetical protein
MNWFRPLPLLVLFALATISGAGCSKIDYDRQVTVVSFPPEQKDARVLLVYEGLRVAGNEPKGKDIVEADKQLAEMIEARKEFWIGPYQPIFQLSLRELPPDKGNDLQSLAREHVVIDVADFFTLPDGRLCARQTLTVRNVDKFVSKLNEIITSTMARSARERLARLHDPNDLFDLDSWRLVAKACRGKFQWVRLEPGRISVTVPASPGAASWFKAEIFGLKRLQALEAAIRNNEAPTVATQDPLSIAVQLRSALGDLCNSAWSFDQRQDRFTVSLGYGDGKPIRFEPLAPPSPPSYAAGDKLRAFARQLKVPFHVGMETAAAVEEFIAELKKN